ncbi:MAG: EamA family transporter RarD [Planctomycetes bacterium]|nr:EamA family transporter RarD [Planctomycetota bacterium]
MTPARAGLLCGVAAYLWWGLVPIYFKAIAHVPADEVLAHRIAWAVLLLALIITARGSWAPLCDSLRAPRAIPMLLASTLLVAVNWYVYIWAVAHDRVLDGSLGYFINPLFSVLLGCLVLRERLRRLQALGVAIAALGVASQAIALGRVPAIALVLAVTFALYGFVRKKAPVGALAGLAVETAILLPFALAYLAWLGLENKLVFCAGGDRTTDLLLALGGVVTATPLLFFASAARRLPLSTVGFLQYIAPTGQFLLAVLAYGEPFTTTHAVAFGCVWGGLCLFTYDLLVCDRRLRPGTTPQEAKN